MSLTSEEIQKQLLARAMDSEYLSKEVLSKGVTDLFKDQPMYQDFARVLINYYGQYKEQITASTMARDISQTLDMKRNQGTLTPEMQDAYLEFSINLSGGNIAVDNSDSTNKALKDYVRKTLGQKIILGDTIAHETQDFDLVTRIRNDLDTIEDLDITGEGTEIISVYGDTERKLELYEEYHKETIDLPSDSMGQLNEALGGGLSKGEMGMVNALQGTGKTTVLSSLSVRYTQQGHNVFHISLEELASQMVLRFDRIAMNMSTNAILNPKDDVKEAWAKDHGETYSAVTQQYLDVSDTFYKQATTKGFNGHVWGSLDFMRKAPRTIDIDQLKQIIKTRERQSGIKYDVVVLDYPDLLINHYNVSESADGGQMYQDLRAMAQSLHVVLWVASQLNRGASSKEVMTSSDMEGSFRKLNTVEFSMTLNRNPEEFKAKQVRFHIDKLRNRKEGYMEDTLWFHYTGEGMGLTSDDASTIEGHRNNVDKEKSVDRTTDFSKNRQTQQGYATSNQMKQINAFNNKGAQGLF